jgi:hypothetical protein
MPNGITVDNSELFGVGCSALSGGGSVAGELDLVRDMLHFKVEAKPHEFPRLRNGRPMSRPRGLRAHR